MNKTDLIKSISEKQNIPLNLAQKAVDSIIKNLTETLAKGERIEIKGFGIFYVKKYPGYTGRNSKTGEMISVKEKKLPVFRVGKELKEMVDW